VVYLYFFYVSVHRGAVMVFNVGEVIALYANENINDCFKNVAIYLDLS